MQINTTILGAKLDEATRDRLKKLGEREKAKDRARWERFVDTGTAMPHKGANRHFEAFAERPHSGLKTHEGLVHDAEPAPIPSRL